MRRLYYAGGTVLVGDRTCKAILRYARALAEAHQSDLVTIPVASEGGGIEHAHFLIGPASQLFDVPVENSSDAPFDPEVIEHLERQTRSLHPATPAWDQELTDMPDLDFLEFGDLPSTEG